MDFLNISNLHASTKEGKIILNGVSIIVKKGEIHAIMGPNGSGKSTLAQVLMSNPAYKIDKGKIVMDGIDITPLSVEKRAKLGLFLAFQDPVAVSGVNFSSFLRLALNETKNGKSKISPIAFRKMLLEKAKILHFENTILTRGVNESFSGGEKKKSEILQMAIMQPKYAVLDEPDSGLDVDGLRYVAKVIETFKNPVGLIVITHYQKIFHHIKPDFVHILVKGKIVKTGNHTLIEKVEKEGYEKYQ